MHRITNFWKFRIIGFLAVVSLWGFLQGAIPAQERAALIAFYNATDGDKWISNYGWKTPPLHTDGFALPGAEDNWSGIEVSDDHVSGIFATYNNVNGCLPPELGNLSHLEEIILYGNPLRGNIPAELGKLSNLRNLELFKAELSGSIPPELGNLSNLKYLGLHENQLSGNIPPELGNLTHLISLELERNKLGGNIPPELGNLSNLVIFDLRHNRLSGSIPPELGNLSKLGSLYLSDNRLSGSIPPEVGNLIRLGWLHLDHNKLSGEIPPGLTNLTQLGTLGLNIRYNCLSATDSSLRNWLNSFDPNWELHQDQCAPPKMHLSRTRLHFSATTSGLETTEQKVRIDNRGGDTLTWAVNVDASWLQVTPTSGSGPGIAAISVNAAGLGIGDYTGTITVSDPNATNSPQAVAVSLKVYKDGDTQNPFGDFSTPLDGTAVSGSIPVTGWALDDIEIAKVEIFSGEIYVGDAVFVEGARPDVEMVFLGFPKNYQAGWGYMMLTNFLPGGGNGTYELNARAIDAEGHQVTLGTKTITVDNAHAVKPFGAIDTPGQGFTAEGRYFDNWGWVLTPQPNMIPNSGETIDVYVDGVNLGHPFYNFYRSDVAALFPGYANSGGASGIMIIDTTTYDNGIHSIFWVATDNAGNSDGIGSRFFTIENLDTSNEQGAAHTYSPKNDTPDPDSLPLKDMEPVQVTRGIGKDRESREIPGNTGNHGAAGINIRELEPMEILLGENLAILQGYMVINGQRRDLPFGSTLDRKTGKFYWVPGAGYIGTYLLEFIIEESGGQRYRRKVEITIQPKFPGEIPTHGTRDKK